MKDTIRLNPECIRCIIKKRLEFQPKGMTKESQIEYMQKMLKIVSEAPTYVSSPVIGQQLEQLEKDMFGMENPYGELKKYFNELMLTKEPFMKESVEASEDKLAMAVQFAMMGNYIDFGALESVDEEKLEDFLIGAKDISINKQTYDSLKKDLENAKQIVYVTDNCGEIVTDKILIKVIQEINPNASLTVMVRGQEVVNDATMEDAVQVGLTKEVNVIGNGSGIAGTWIPDLSEEAGNLLKTADVILAKGQGNFETMQMCGLNVYYIFMCKCDMFAKRFQVPKFSGMMVNDKELGKKTGGQMEGHQDGK